MIGKTNWIKNANHHEEHIQSINATKEKHRDSKRHAHPISRNQTSVQLLVLLKM